MKPRRPRVGGQIRARVSDEFFAELGQPIFWQFKAAELNRAAEVVLRQVEQDDLLVRTQVQGMLSGGEEKFDPPTSIYAQYFLLAAFSLENQFKSFVLHLEPNLVRKGKVEGIVASHDLLLLARRAKVDLSPDEVEFCKLAASAAVNWGRYPIPRHSGDVLSEVRCNMAGAAITYRDLYGRLKAMELDRFRARLRLSHSQSTDQGKS